MNKLNVHTSLERASVFWEMGGPRGLPTSFLEMIPPHLSWHPRPGVDGLQCPQPPDDTTYPHRLLRGAIMQSVLKRLVKH